MSLQESALARFACLEFRFAGRQRRFLVLALLLWGTANAASTDALFAAKLVTSDDKPIALESLRGKPLIVNFWARWCAPCRVEIPELIKTQEKYGKRGLTVIGIGLEDKAESVRDFMKAYDVNYTVLLARDQGIPLMQALGNVRAGLPFTVIIDRRGEILATRLGAMNREQLEASGKAAIQ